MANSQFAMAVHVMAMLAKNCDERIKSSYIAKSVNTNAVVIRRLLSDLHEANLVVSQTGYSGGTCLTRQPADVCLLEIYEAVSHDNIFGLHAKEPDRDCEIGSTITGVLGKLQVEIDEAVKQKFASYTLQDVIDELVKCKEEKGEKILSE
ncbi:MAG: Rrf2 family transcriptional regulator [Pyrinomonadaceae bacterium]|nr:Rrf2 family transcriptional regulator [Pyrinomonadaceae bacterium]